MEEKEKKNEAGGGNFPQSVPDIAFRSDEMIGCRRCGRTNPPTRLQCLYCGGDLEVSAERARRIDFNPRPMETWERGYNLIWRAERADLSPAMIAEAARALQKDEEFLQKIVAAQRPLPVARLESEAEAAILRERLGAANFDTLIVSDEALTGQSLPRRLRRLDFRDGKVSLILFNNDEVIEFDAAEIKLLVTGAVFQRAVETSEKRHKGESRILDAIETASDDLVLDLYDRSNPTGYRIQTKGFDFSCLGAEKGILARENIRRLAARWQKFAARAGLVDDYLRVREVLGYVWEVEQTNDSQGFKKQNFGRPRLSRVTLSSNLQQFTKYSRLQWHLL